MVVRARKPMTDQEVDEVIGTLLRWGVVIAATVVGIGGLWYLIQYGGGTPNYRVFHGEPKNLRSLRGIVGGIERPQCLEVIQFGVVLLIATPVSRVAFSVVAFLMEHDHKYVIITLIVLSVLLFSLLGMH
jgi:uncharacterized membrane protein